MPEKVKSVSDKEQVLVDKDWADHTPMMQQYLQAKS
jgi:hypothetical protein